MNVSSRLLGFLLLASCLFLGGFSPLEGQVPSGNGSGDFLPPVFYPVAENPTDMSLGDFNQDGIPDLIIATEDDGQIQVLLGNGDGSFDSNQIPTVLLPQEIRETYLGYFDGDDVMDLLVTTEELNNIYLLRGLDTGAFEDPELIYVHSESIGSISTGDINEDGQDDIVLSSICGIVGCGTTRILMSDSSGNLQLDPVVYPDSLQVLVRDLDEDGDLDLLLGSSLMAVYLNDGNGNLSEFQQIPVTYEIDQLLLIDVFEDNPDGVGILDVVCLIDGGDGLAFLPGFGDGSFGSPVERYGDELDFAEDLVAAQLDGNGTPDLLFFSRAADEMVILRGHGLDGVPYQQFSTYPLPPDPVCMEVADFNNDGVLDVVLASGSEDLITVFIGIEAQAEFRRGDANADGFFNLADPITVLEALFVPGGGVSGCADAFDANDDGILDLADPVSSLMFLFANGARLPEPFPDCGDDPSSDTLECQLSLSGPCP